MKISNIKYLEKNIKNLTDQIKYLQEGNTNSNQENEILIQLNNELNRISDYVINLRVLKRSPPGLIINFLKRHIAQNFPLMNQNIGFQVDDEKTINIMFDSTFLGYDLSTDDNYDPVNEQDYHDWSEIFRNVKHIGNPLCSFLDRLNKLDDGLSCEIDNTCLYGSEVLNFTIRFNKIHANSDIVESLWKDVLGEIVGICNFNRNRKQLPLI